MGWMSNVTRPHNRNRPRLRSRTGDLDLNLNPRVLRQNIVCA